MASEVVVRQTLKLRGYGFDGLAAFLNVAAEFERKSSSFFMQRLQAVARGLIFVYAGKPITEQRALDVMARRGTGSFQAHRDEHIVNGTVQAEGAAGHRYALRFKLRLVAHG